ncbi:sorting nexin-1-like isoform X2 [Myxocyprinus asiaticus]|uniref:sorting nexin-1-like isoform X2 n=1 Tax=Myxocyprinus asiaticus TaxID=70543 RepID=UPI002221DB87|nr:sorting nexin-1-like isoform X2 [Myxocyprinus asiaticus]
MSDSCGRNPPPFPDNEDQEAELDNRVPDSDDDDDEGEDIFTGARSKPITPSSAADEDPEVDIFSEEGSYIRRDVHHTTNGLHSDEELDLFTEATVELTLTNTTSQGRREIIGPTASASNPTYIPNSIHKSSIVTKTMEELEEEEGGDQFELNIAVTNPEKMGDGMNAYMSYKVSTQTTLPMFHNKTFTVRRRFSDFLGLYEKLSAKHSLLGCIIPSPPQKSVVGMTKVKVGKEDSSSAEFVEKRRAALERYLQRVVAHPSLLQDPDVREFLERDELPRAVNTQTLSGPGLLKMINRASDAVNKMTIKINESNNWFESKLQELESEEQLLRRLHAAVDSLVNHRKELCSNTAVFSKTVAMLGSVEENSALSRALSQLAEVEDKMEQLHQQQAFSDFFILAELLADYVRLLGAVRCCFEQRMKVWQRLQEAQSTLQKKREAEAKLLWANKPDKLQQAKDDINEWESKVSQYERDFERVTCTVRKEVLRFEKDKTRDFKQHIVKYLESLLHKQHRVSVSVCVLHISNTLSLIVIYIHPAGEVLGGLPARGKSHRLIRVLPHTLLTFDLDNRQSTFLPSSFLCSLCLSNNM